ncbi:hypothetical protein AVEN_249744-1 [Araneus ventricosus]|uniref:Uncharacterized protein n=1 Tax=Araneus ventricosus TaxID=182803 RepID=A0A4Y2C5F6_ARAVE|nr:hypothetical protein AVEN_249744-1 [Araneus ventricosus]
MGPWAYETRRASSRVKECLRKISRHVRIPHCRRRLTEVKINRLTNVELANILSLHDLVNGNGPIAAWLNGKKMSNEARTQSPIVHGSASELFRVWILRGTDAGYQLFGRRWTERSRRMPPPRSPDLSPIDFLGA